MDEQIEALIGADIRDGVSPFQIRRRRIVRADQILRVAAGQGLEWSGPEGRWIPIEPAETGRK